MTSIGSPSPFFFGGKKAYAVDRSLRFNSGDSPELTRTPSGAGNRKTWTLSFWAKISDDDLGSHGFLFSTGADSSNKVQINLESSNRLTFEAKSGGSTQAYIRPSNNFRDISAWYHFVIRVDTTDSTSTNRIKIYINGTQQTDLALNTFPSEDAEFEWNKAQEHNIGKRTYSSNYFNGYLAEINFIDGQAYDSSYFGETDSITGQWNPIKYVGSYGTNGFYLNFSDNSGATATTLGKDYSGNGNNFTPNNFSVAAGVGNDSVSDTPTNNFCTFNPLKVNAATPVTYSEGNLQYNGVSGNNHLRSSATIPVSSGKWYVEFKMVSGYSATDPTIRIGIITASAGHRDSNNDGLYYENTNNATSVNYGANGAVYVINTSQITGLTTYTNNDVMGIALDLDNDKFFVSKNGTFFSNGTGTQDPAAGTNPLYSGGVLTSRKSEGFEIAIQGYSDKVVTADFGQQGFAYTPPAGFKAICTANLPDPAINFPNKHFDTVLYTGDGNATGSQTNVLEFQPDFLWSKPRNAAYVHLLYDSVRGAGSLKALNLGGGTSPGAGGEGAAVDNSVYGFLNSFDANGFSYTKGSFSTTYFNQSGINYVVWNWNAGNSDGKTYTVKVHDFSGNNRYIFDDFQTQAVTLDLAEGGTYIFNMDDASNASHPFSIGTAANGTVYTSGITYFLDGVSKTYSEYTSGFAAATTRRLHITVPASAPVLYYWCSVHSGMGGQINTNSTLGSSNFDGSIQTTVKVNTTAGFSIVTYEGNGTEGATIGHGLGVTPSHVIWKNRDAAVNWINWQTQLADTCVLLNNDIYAITASGNGLFTYGDFNSTQLKLKTGTHTNGNNNSIVAYCFSEVAGYSKFGKYTGNGSSDGTFVFTGFRPAVVIQKRTDTTGHWYIFDNKRNGFNVDNDSLSPNLVDAEYDVSIIDLLSNGFKFRTNAAAHNGSGGTYIYLAFAESPFKNARAR